MKLRTMTAAAAAAALTLTLAACGGGDNAAQSGDAGGDKGTITIGFIPSWTDGLSTAHLSKKAFETMGYQVEFEPLSEAAVLYAGLAQGDVDVYTSAWPEVTHKAYMEQYGDQIEDLDAYYGNAKLTFAVPTYLDDVNSIEDLKGRAAEFDGKIVGIEPGAGHMKITQEQVIPQYELGSEYQLVTSSTPAMLAELKTAIDANKPIVVTLWRPFWANSTFDVKDLEDPKGALGETESLRHLGKKTFSQEFPDAAEFLKDMDLDDEQYNDLENKVVNEYGEGREAEAIDAWLKDNPDAIEMPEAQS